MFICIHSCGFLIGSHALSGAAVAVRTASAIAVIAQLLRYSSSTARDKLCLLNRSDSLLKFGKTTGFATFIYKKTATGKAKVAVILAGFSH
jgi:hypothetical protein